MSQPNHMPSHRAELPQFRTDHPIQPQSVGQLMTSMAENQPWKDRDDLWLDAREAAARMSNYR